MRTLIMLLAMTGCASVPEKPEFEASEVIERIGNREQTPEWAHGEIAMVEEDGQIVFINQLTMDGNSRPESCMSGASLSGRSGMLRYVKDNLTSSGQLDETNEDVAMESFTAFLSEGSLSGVKDKQRYWERLEVSDQSGKRVLKIRCVVQIAIKKSELQRQLKAAVRAGGNKEIQDRILQAQQKFFDSISKSSSLSH